MTVHDRVTRFLEQTRDVVILRAELAHLGSNAQFSRVLAKLVREKKLIRVSVGVYAKTRVNRFTGELTPVVPFENIARETFKKLGIEVSPGRAARDYNAGRTTQVPVEPVVNTGRRRIRRRIVVGSRAVIYERGSQITEVRVHVGAYLAHDLTASMPPVAMGTYTDIQEAGAHEG